MANRRPLVLKEGQVEQLQDADALDVFELVTLSFGISGALETGAHPFRLHAPKAGTCFNVKASLGTAPAGASVLLDVNRNGSTIFTTQANRPTITAGNRDDLSSAPDDTTVAENDVFTLDVDQVGSSTPGSDLLVQVQIKVRLATT